MLSQRGLLVGLICGLGMAAGFTASAQDAPPTNVGWKKTVIEKKFRAEGVAVADVNKDGQQDILVGDVWYEAPEWKIHEIRKPGDFGDGSKGYSQTFACWADDINNDGWADLIVIGFPGAPCHWYENPKNEPGHWKQHMLWYSACNETPLYVDLFGTGKRVLIMGFQPLTKIAPDIKTTENQGQLAWFEPGKTPTDLWDMHPISEPSEPGKQQPGTFKYYHGLGVGDLNGDGKNEVLTPNGWWEQPAAPQGHLPWKFHAANLGAACADMHTLDITGDGKADVISSSAHQYGIWAHIQRAGEGSEPGFTKQDLFPKLFSQTHAMHLVDVNGDGVKDFVTGKRRWAHGTSGDPDPNLPPVLFWFESKKSADGAIEFIPRQIDDDSGVGTQFWMGDFNGDKLPDIVIGNKHGVFLFEQTRK